MADALKTWLKVISVLSKPQFHEFQGAIQTVAQVLENNLKLAGDIQTFQGNYEKLAQFGIQKCHAQDVRWAYSCSCLEALLQLSWLLENESKNKDSSSSSKAHAPCEPLYLSVQQEKEVAACFQLVVAFGLLPNLVPNIGVPIQKRSNWPVILNQAQPTSDEQKYSRLTVTVRALCKLELNPILGPKLATKHSTDLLAGLLQLCHAPISKPTSDDQVLLWQRLHEERLEFIPMLDTLIERTYPPLLVRSLQLLQGPSPSHAKVIRDALQPAPRWMTRVCGHLLTQQLLKPNGVALTIAGIMDMGEITTDMWQLCDSLALLISKPPSKDPAKQREYYSIIGPQLANLIEKSSHSKTLSKGPLARIASGCYREIALRYLHVAEQSVFAPLFEPLKSDDEDQLVACIEMLHAIFVVGTDPSSFHQLLEPHAQRLLLLYRKWCHGILQARNLLEDLIVRIIRHNEGQDRVDLLRCLLDIGQPKSHTIETPESDEFLEEDEKSVTAFLAILERVEDSKQSEYELTYSVFVSLLEDLPRLMSEHPIPSLLASNQSKLLESVRRGLMTIKLIGVLSENECLQNYLLDRPVKGVEFAQVFLKRAADNLQRAHYDLDLEKEGLAIVFAVIALQIENLIGKEGKSDVWSLFEPLVKPLEALAKGHSLERIRSGADELRLAIQTRGFAYKKRSRDDGKNEFQTAWDQLDDPLLPVQGHAILTMSHLLKTKDDQAMRHRDELLDVFVRSLEHEDSYIYLMSIQALVSLGDVYTDKVVNTLVEQLEQLTNPKLITEIKEGDDSTVHQPVKQRPPEVRLKVGEALIQVVRLIGPLIPKYKNLLLNAFLRGTRDPDPFVRASCLQNLGELCALLRYSLDAVAYELVNCVSNLVFRDPAVEVRRAAVLLTGLLLRGLDSDALLVLEPIIKDLYRVLKEVVIRDNDDKVVTFHANQALEKLADIAKRFLTGPQVPVTGKTICQLRLP